MQLIWLPVEMQFGLLFFVFSLRAPSPLKLLSNVGYSGNMDFCYTSEYLTFICLLMVQLLSKLSQEELVPAMNWI